MKSFIFCFSLFIFSCTQQKDPLLKVWFYNDHIGKDDQIKNYYKYHSVMEYGFNSASFINLQPDGTFTSYLSGFDYGKWMCGDSTLIMINHDNGKLELGVKRLANDKMVCINKRNNKVYEFNGFPNKFDTSINNPFSKENNYWRIKAKHKESDLEIADRLKNHFSFWEKYFAWGLHSEISTLNIGTTPSLLEMYGNGFKLHYYDNEPLDWKNIFYDSADSWKAYEKLYYIMAEKDIKWPDSKNRFVGFVSAFQQLQQWMEDSKKKKQDSRLRVSSGTK